MSWSLVDRQLSTCGNRWLQIGTCSFMTPSDGAQHLPVQKEAGQWKHKHSLCRVVFVYITLLLCNNYRIALIFRGSKFSRIAALKKFVEKISQIRVVHVCYSAVSQILVE